MPTTTTTTTSTAPGPDDQLDEARLGALVEQVVGDFGAVLNAALVVVGDRLGLYRALAADGWSTSTSVAEATGCVERNVREWLSAQAASGFVLHRHTPTGDEWALGPEQREAFTSETSPGFLCGGFQVVTAATRAIDRITEVFRTGEGLGWHEHHHDLFQGTERFFRPGYAVNLVDTWIPALDGIAARLAGGARAADIGCGHGASTILMAAAFPASTFAGFDYHGPSVEAARVAAAAAGVGDRASFEVASAGDFPGSGYDLITYFDCLHDMGDPVGALRHARGALSPGGSVMVVEPSAGDEVEDNLNPVGRIFYAASTLICTPASQHQDVGLALGAQAGERRLLEVAARAGFDSIRRVADTPFNMVLELRVDPS